MSNTDRANRDLVSFAPTEEGRLALNLNKTGVAVVQQWIQKPAMNYGFMFVNTRSTDSFAFASSEADKSRKRPKLTITFTPSRR